MATSISRAEVLNLIQAKPSANVAGYAKKKGVCHSVSRHWSRECPENKGKGRNGNGNERAKDVKSWRSTPPPSGAPQVKQATGKTFNWCASCKQWATTHIMATHTGSKKGADGTNGGGSAISNVSLPFDPLVWTATDNEVTPSVADALYVLRTMVTRKFPVLFLLLTYVTAMFSASFAKTMWIFSVPLILCALRKTCNPRWRVSFPSIGSKPLKLLKHIVYLFGLIDTHQEALIAPLLCLLMTAVVFHWLPNIIATPPESDPRRYLLAAIVVPSSNTIARAHAAQMLLRLAAFAPMDCTASTLSTYDLWDTTFGAMRQPWLNDSSSKCS